MPPSKSTSAAATNATGNASASAGRISHRMPPLKAPTTSISPPRSRGRRPRCRRRRLRPTLRATNITLHSTSSPAPSATAMSDVPRAPDRALPGDEPPHEKPDEGDRRQRQDEQAGKQPGAEHESTGASSSGPATSTSTTTASAVSAPLRSRGCAAGCGCAVALGDEHPGREIDQPADAPDQERRGEGDAEDDRVDVEVAAEPACHARDHAVVARSGCSRRGASGRRWAPSRAVGG